MSVSAALLIAFAIRAPAQAFDENCTVSVNGQFAVVDPDGSFQVDNIQITGGLLRVSAICERHGLTLYGASEFFDVIANQVTPVAPFALSPTPLPTLSSIMATADAPLLSIVGETTQVQVEGDYSDGLPRIVNLRTDGTSYVSSNPAIATVDQDGLVTAVSNGTAWITVNNQGATAVTAVNVSVGDPGTQVEGFVVDETGAFVPNAMVTIPSYGISGVTGSDGRFCLGCSPPFSVPSQLADPIFVQAEAMLGGEVLVGVAGPFTPLPELTIDAGLVVLNTRLFSSVGGDPAGDLDWQMAVNNSFVEEDFESYSNGFVLDRYVAGPIDVNLSLQGIGGAFPAVEIFYGNFGTSPADGTVHNSSLLNRRGPRRSRIRFDFDPAIRGFGTWVFDDFGADLSFDMRVVYETGGVVTSPRLYRVGNGVEGFLGVVVSSPTIAAVEIVSLDPAGLETTNDFFELDHSQVAPR